eukprot:INCI17302.1.p1 GENE.INCI17302.1~~INCI17302.1.p1  ORF type:complete len:1611 (+),score=317.81 INCI17302.1:256-5088(+)
MLQRAALNRKVATASCIQGDDDSTAAKTSGTTESHLGKSQLESRGLAIAGSSGHTQDCSGVVESMAEASRRTLVLSEHICKLQRRIHAKLLKSGKSLTDMWQKATSTPILLATQSHNDSTEQTTDPSANAPSACTTDCTQAYLKQKEASDFQAELLSIKRGVSNILKAERRLLSQHLVSFGIPVSKMNKLLNRNLTDEMAPSILEQASETFASVDTDLRLDRLEPVRDQVPKPQLRRSTSTQTDTVETLSTDGSQKSSTSQTSPTLTQEMAAGLDCKVDSIVEPQATLHRVPMSVPTDKTDSSDDDLTPLVQRAVTATRDDASDRAIKKNSINDGQSATHKDLQFHVVDTSSPAEMTAQLQTLRWEESVFAKVRERRIERLAVESCAKQRAVLEQDVRNTDAELARIAVAKHQLQIHFRKKFDAKLISKPPEILESPKRSPFKRKADQAILAPRPVITQVANTQVHDPSHMIIRSEFSSGSSQHSGTNTMTGVVLKPDGSPISSVEKSKAKNRTPLEKLFAKIQESSRAKQLQKREHQIASRSEVDTTGRSNWAPREMLPFAQGGHPNLNALAVVDDEPEDLLNLSDVSAIPLASPSPVLSRATRQRQQEDVQNHLAILGEEGDGSSNDAMSTSSSEVRVAPEERPVFPRTADELRRNHSSALVARELFTFEKDSAQTRPCTGSLEQGQFPQALHREAKPKENVDAYSSAGSTSSASSRSRTSSLSDEVKASLLRRAFQIGKKIAAVAEKARAKDPQHEVDLHELLQEQAGLSNCDSSLETDDDASVVSCQTAVESHNQPQDMEISPTAAIRLHKSSEPRRNFTTYIPPVHVVANPTLAESSVETPTKMTEVTMNWDSAGSAAKTTGRGGTMMVNDGYDADRSMLETTPSAGRNSTRRVVKIKNSKRSRKPTSNDVVDRLMRPTFASATRSMPTQCARDESARSSSTSLTPVKRRSRGRKSGKSPLQTKRRLTRSASKGSTGRKTAKASARAVVLNSSNSTPNASSSVSCVSVEALSSEDELLNDDVSDAREQFLAKITQRTRAKQQLVRSFQTASPSPTNHGSSQTETKAADTSTSTACTSFANHEGNQSWSSTSETSPADSRHKMRRHEAKFGDVDNESKTDDFYEDDVYKSNKAAWLHSVRSDSTSSDDFSETKEAHDIFNSPASSATHSKTHGAEQENQHDDSETQDPSIESGLTEVMDASAGTETEFPAGLSGEDSEPFDLLGHRSPRLATVTGFCASSPTVEAESLESTANSFVWSRTRQAMEQKKFCVNSGFSGVDVVYTDGPSTTTEEEDEDNDFDNRSESRQVEAPINASTVSTGPRPMSKLPLPSTPPRMSSCGGVNLETLKGLHGGSQNSSVSAPSLPSKKAVVNASNTTVEGAAATIDAIAQRRQEREAIWAHIRATKSVAQQEPKPMLEEPVKTSHANMCNSSPNKTLITTSRRVGSVKSKLQRAHQRRLTLDKLRSIRTRLDSWKGRIPEATGVFTSRYGKVSPFIGRARNMSDTVNSSQALTAGTMPLDQQAVAWLDSAEQYLLELEKAESTKERELAQTRFPQTDTDNKERANAASRVLAKQNAEQARRLLDHIARLRDGSANKPESRDGPSSN